MVRERARSATDDQMRALLGDERFFAYLMRDDPTYKQFVEMTERLAQPITTAVRLWQAKNEFTTHQGDIAVEFRADYKTRDEKIASLNDNVVSQVAALVGESVIRDHPNAFNWLPQPKGVTQPPPATPK